MSTVKASQAVGRLRPRVSLFVVKAAVAVMNEDPTTVNHAERVTFAIAVLNDDYNLSGYTKAVLTNPTILSNLDLAANDLGISDGDLEFTVNSLYNAFAGVST